MESKYKFLLAVLTAFAMFAIPSKIYAATYYVSTSGDDSNSGQSVSSPFLTIQKGLNLLSAPGDTLYIRGGTYKVGAMSLTNKTGTNIQNIVVSGYQNERPILDAKGNIAGLWDNFIFFRNLKYVTIKNLEITNSRTKGIYLSDSNNITFQDLWIHNTALAAIWTENSNDVVIENSRFWQNNKVNDPGCSAGNADCPSWYSGGQWMGTIHPRGNTSTSSPYTTNIIIRKNEIFEGYGECINAHGRISGLTVEDNKIYNCWAPAVYFPNDKDVIIQRNLIYQTNDPRFLRGGDPGSCIGAQKEALPTRPGEMKNIKIINNFVKGCRSSFFFWQHDGGFMEDALIANNTLVDAHSNSATSPANNINIGAGPHINTRFENNIIIQNDKSGILGVADGSVSFSNNLWSSTPPSNMMGTGSLVADPKLAMVGNIGAGQLTPLYFNLLSSSPAINKGKDVLVSLDFYGNPRTNPDIGANEYLAGGNSATLAPTPTSTPVPTATIRTPTPTASPFSGIGDINNDGVINVIDIGLIIDNYGKGAAVRPKADLNNDGVINVVDIGVIIDNYSR